MEIAHYNIVFAVFDDCTCNGISFTSQNELYFLVAVRSKYHFDVNVFGAANRYDYSCTTISYEQTGRITTEKVAAMLPATIFNCNVLNEENVREVIAEAAFNNSFN